MVRSNSQEIQKSIRKIKSIKSIPARVDALNELAWSLRYQQKDLAYQLSQEACDLSLTGEFGDQPYLRGQANSLVIQGSINLGRDRLDESLKQNIQALAILREMPAQPAMIDAWITICWIYLSLGEFPTAFDYALMGLQLARELGVREREASALDALGSTYGYSGEYKNSVENHEEALHILRELGNRQAEAMALNNMACSLLDMGKYADAYIASDKSLELAEELGFFEEELAFATTIADILTKMGAYEKAATHLQEAFNKTRDKDLQPTQADILISMARLNMAQGDFAAAEPFLSQALSIARRFDFKNDQMVCHQLLSETYEHIDSPVRALEHFKQYFALKEATTGAETARKIAMLKAANQLEISKRETEIYRVQNLELQQEIEERKRAETLLEDLAIRDPLTNTLNRRQFSMLANSEIEKASRQNHPLSALMIDIDNFKEVNDKFGHLVGDHVLTSVAAVIQSILRESDIVGRYGGDEFAILLPETSETRAFEVAERLRNAIGQAKFEGPNGSLNVTISLGVAQLAKPRKKAGTVLDELQHQADQALYAAKRAGRNQSHTFRNY